MRKWIPIFFMSLAFLGLVDGADQRGDEAAIRQKSQEYVKAYNSKDAAKVAQYWKEDAVYTNLRTGRSLSGREEIQEEFAEIFEEEPNLRLEASTESVSFPENGQAVELGTGVITDSSGNKEKIRYRAVYALDQGEWLLTSVSDLDEQEPPTHYDQLKDLEWLIGEWEDADDDVQIESKYEWDKYKNFIKHHYKITALGKEELEGKRIIGWDPVNEVVRSWHFDSYGGFAEAEWRKVGNQWVIESIDTLPDGGLGTQIHVVTPIDNDAFTYQISGRTIDGEILPSIDPVKVVRKRG